MAARAGAGPTGLDENVSRGARVRVQQFHFSGTQRVNEVEQWFGGEKALRAELEAKSIFFLRRDNAAGRTPASNTRTGSRLLKMISAGQAGIPPPMTIAGIELAPEWTRNLDRFFQSVFETAGGFPIVCFFKIGSKAWRCCG